MISQRSPPRYPTLFQDQAFFSPGVSADVLLRNVKPISNTRIGIELAFYHPHDAVDLARIYHNW